MRQLIEISTDQVKPDRYDVLRTQGILPDKDPSERIEQLLKEATQLFAELSRPAGVLSAISASAFEAVYAGEGLNESKTPLETIIKGADGLALFAVTIGADVGERISRLFNADEFALGSMLDSVASVGTERAADIVESRFVEWLSNQGKVDSSTGVLIYSPGYCGWHVSGQKKLFEFLRPQEVGIELLDSFLMKPLKSMSGVIVAGNKKIHYINDSYIFCRECKTHSCRDRIRTLQKD